MSAQQPSERDQPLTFDEMTQVLNEIEDERGSEHRLVMAGLILILRTLVEIRDMPHCRLTGKPWGVTEDE